MTTTTMTKKKKKKKMKKQHVCLKGFMGASFESSEFVKA